MKIFTSAVSAFHLREQPFSAFDFPRWHAWLCVIGLSVPYAFHPAFTGAPSNMPDDPLMPLWLALVLGLVNAVIILLVMTGVLRWWLRRGGRWDGQGSMFNLIVSSTLVASLLSLAGALLGIPVIVLLPLWLYSVWVSGNAISGAIPRASLGYAISGMILSAVLATFLVVCLMVAVTLVFASFGAAWAPDPAIMPPADA